MDSATLTARTSMYFGQNFGQVYNLYIMALIDIDRQRNNIILYFNKYPLHIQTLALIVRGGTSSNDVASQHGQYLMCARGRGSLVVVTSGMREEHV